MKIKTKLNINILNTLIIYSDYISNNTLNNCNQGDNDYICNDFNTLKKKFNEFNDSTELTISAMRNYLYLTMIINVNNFYNFIIEQLPTVNEYGNTIDKINSGYNSFLLVYQ